MTKSQTALIREASKKEVGANRWRQRMEKWRELQNPVSDVNWELLTRTYLLNAGVPKHWLKPSRIS